MKTLTPQEAMQAFLDGRRVQLRRNGKDWHDVNANNKLDIFTNGRYEFRLYQEYINVGGIRFPKPITKKPKDGDTVYISCATSSIFYIDIVWDKNHSPHQLFFKRGLVYLDRESAIAHAKALIKLSGGSYDQ